MVDFHGYELPIWYSSIQEEHLATRNSAGLFDVSHMGLFRFVGEGVRSWLSSVSTQEYIKFQPGRCGYSHFLDYEGHIIDDMIFAVSSEKEVLGVPNSTMVGKMFEWIYTYYNVFIKCCRFFPTFFIFNPIPLTMTTHTF